MSSLQKLNELLNEKNSLRATVIFTITTLCVYGMSYLYQCFVLNSWNIPIEFANGIDIGKNFYFIVLGILYCISIAFLQNYLFHALLPTAAAKILSKQAKRILKNNKKQIKETRKAIYSQAYGDFKKYRKVNNITNRHIFRKQIKKMVKTDFEELFIQSKNTQKMHNRISRKVKKLKFFTIIPILIISSLYTALSSILFYKIILPQSLNYPLISFLILIPISLFFPWKSSIKEAKQKYHSIQKKKSSRLPLMEAEKLAEIINEITNIVKTRTTSISTLKTVLGFKQICFSISCGILSMLLMCLAFGVNNKSLSNDFWICNINNDYFVPIHITEDKTIYKKASSIDDNEIIIDLNKNLYNMPESILCEKKHFLSVKWLE